MYIDLLAAVYTMAKIIIKCCAICEIRYYILTGYKTLAILLFQVHNQTGRELFLFGNIIIDEKQIKYIYLIYYQIRYIYGKLCRFA